MITNTGISGTATAAREEARAAWDDIAAGYDAFVTPTHIDLALQALERAGLRAGMRFLDVACGSGALSIPAARLGAHVVATDLSPLMVRRLEARARKEGLAQIEARVMDGHALDLPDDAFDVAGSEFGVMLFPDLPRALRELRRVTVPGGRVVIVAFGPPEHVEFLGFFLGAIRAVTPGFTGLPTDPPPLPFQVADRTKLVHALEAAGLGSVRVEAATERLEFQSGDDMWNWVTNSNPIARGLIAGLSDAQKADVRLVLDGMLRERSEGSGAAALTSLVHIAVATK